MINTTNLANDEQVLSIIIGEGRKDDVKAHLFEKLPMMERDLIDEDYEEMLFIIPAYGCGYSLNQVRGALNTTKADYQVSILCVDNGKFDRPVDVGG